MEPPTLKQAIAELERELALRRRCYPKWVEQRRLSQGNADHQIACIVLAIENLRDLQQQGELFAGRA